MLPLDQLLHRPSRKAHDPHALRLLVRQHAVHNRRRRHLGPLATGAMTRSGDGGRTRPEDGDLAVETFHAQRHEDERDQRHHDGAVEDWGRRPAHGRARDTEKGLVRAEFVDADHVDAFGDEEMEHREEGHEGEGVLVRKGEPVGRALMSDGVGHAEGFAGSGVVGEFGADDHGREEAVEEEIRAGYDELWQIGEDERAAEPQLGRRLRDVGCDLFEVGPFPSGCDGCGVDS